jgi:2-hydroxychromene-2-carboxylate isomerase
VTKLSKRLIGVMSESGHRGSPLDSPALKGREKPIGHVDFYFDYRSPYSYMANTQTSSIEACVVYRPLDLMALFELAKNPARTSASPSKGRYSHLDLARWARAYGVPFQANSRLGQVDSKLLANGAIAAQRLGVFPVYHTTIFDALWVKDLDLASSEERSATLRRAGLDGELTWRLAAQEDVARERDGNTRRAFDAGAFGTPTFVYNNWVFFGNDRITMLNDRIRYTRLHGASEAARLA